MSQFDDEMNALLKTHDERRAREFSDRAMSRPFAPSPPTYWTQPYPRRPADLSGLASILRETAEKKEPVK